MTVRFRRFPLVLLAATAIAGLSACASSAGPGTPVSSASAPAAAASASATPLVVPAGEGGGALSTPRTLTMPAGWTAKVWARVPDARMEAWTPEGNLLVSQPNRGTIVELRPGASGPPAMTVVVQKLTSPQGMAFARLAGKWVLYVAETDEIDRYPWAAGGISGPRTVIAGGLPDLDPGGDDVHRMKDVTVAADGTVYFNVGSSSNANPDDRTMSPQRAVIMAVRPDGSGLRVVLRGVRNGEGLAVAPDGTVWTAINKRDNIPYPSHGAYGGEQRRVRQGHPGLRQRPPAGRGGARSRRAATWAGRTATRTRTTASPEGSLANVPLVPNSVTNPGGTKLNCAALAPIEVGVPAHSAPLGTDLP